MENLDRPRARKIGLNLGTLPPGPLNSIIDVEGVKVGHDTLILGDDVRTGVTAILPHEANIFQEKVPGAIFVGNGVGKLAGSTQVNELGEIETPIMLTNTLCVARVADALIEYMLSMPENQDVTSINPLVAETNDWYLNDIRNRRVGKEETFRALRNAKNGSADEGCVGAGTGTRALGFKGGIGTSSRIANGFRIGVLVQTNYSGLLTISGAPVGRELQNPSGKFGEPKSVDTQGSGSVIVVIATDAPLSTRNLSRLASRSSIGLGRTGFVAQNFSGDYFIAFSTAKESRIEHFRTRPRPVEELRNDEINPLFLGVIEATEESVYNSLFRATTTKGRNNHVVEALPIGATIEILQKFHAI